MAAPTVLYDTARLVLASAAAGLAASTAGPADLVYVSDEEPPRDAFGCSTLVAWVSGPAEETDAHPAAGLAAEFDRIRTVALTSITVTVMLVRCYQTQDASPATRDALQKLLLEDRYRVWTQLRADARGGAFASSCFGANLRGGPTVLAEQGGVAGFRIPVGLILA